MQRLAVLLAVGCSSSGTTTPPTTQTAAGRIHFYCAASPTAEGQCVLATKGGTDAFAKRYEKSCGGGACTEREGAWCFAKPPASAEITTTFRGDSARCFAEEADCESRVDHPKTLQLCSPLSAEMAIKVLDDTGFDRVDPPPVRYFCSDAGGTDHCFDSFWSCAYRRHQWQRPTTPCRAVETAWCTARPMPEYHIDRPIEMCLASREKCESERQKDSSACVEKKSSP